MSATELLRLVPDAPAAVGRDPRSRARSARAAEPLRDLRPGALRPARPQPRRHPRARASRPRARPPSSRACATTSASCARRTATSAVQATTGYDVSPAAEWLLDNFHLIEAQLREIDDGLPRRYFRDLPVLQDEPLVGLPRVYGVAWAFVAHTDSAFDEELLVHFLRAYEETRELTLGELWALPTTLRVVLIENLRRLAERVAANKAAREVANLCCDRHRGLSARARSTRCWRCSTGAASARRSWRRWRSACRTRAPRPSRPRCDWLRRVAPHLAEIQTRLPAAQAADNLSVSNAITSLRSIGDADWPDIVGHDQRADAADAAARRPSPPSATTPATRRCTRSRSWRGRAASSERAVAADAARADARATTSRPPASDDAEERRRLLAARPRAAASCCRALGLRESHGLAAAGPAAPRAPCPSTSARSRWPPRALVAWMLLRHSAALAPGIVAVAGALARAADAVSRLGGGGRGDQPADQRIGAAEPPAAAGVRERHPARAPDDGRDPGDADRARVRSARSPTSCSCTTSPIPSATRSSRCSPTGADADDRAAAPTTPPCSTRRCRRSSASMRSTRRAPTSRRASSSCIASGRFAESEQRWIGWERKRGKLEQLLAPAGRGLGRARSSTSAAASTRRRRTRATCSRSTATRGCRPGALRELVGVAAHPHNRPRLAADGRRVARGYGILQPHVATPLPRARGRHALPLAVRRPARHRPVQRRELRGLPGPVRRRHLHRQGPARRRRRCTPCSAAACPTNQVLSHDLLEGSLARCAAVTDVTVIEDAPFHADVAASRVHRWTRGDWQLLPFLLRAGPLSRCAPSTAGR